MQSLAHGHTAVSRYASRTVHRYGDAGTVTFVFTTIAATREIGQFLQTTVVLIVEGNNTFSHLSVHSYTDIPVRLLFCL